jgi:hypothetical protein
MQPLAWEPAADSPQLADFSRMQPAHPNPWHILLMIFFKMVSVAGAKETELQGASSVMRVNRYRTYLTEDAQGET